MAKNIQITIDKLPALAKGLALLSNTRVLVGVPADKSARTKATDGPINNAALMYIHENGAPEANIPARPVVAPTIKENQQLIAKALAKAGEIALSGGGAEGVNKQLNSLGLVMQNKLRAKITEGPFVPLSERTLAARRAKGRTGTSPLIDTGQLRRSLTYVLRTITGGLTKLKG